MCIRDRLEEHFDMKLIDMEVLLLASVLRQHANSFDREKLRKSKFGLILASSCKERAISMAKNINRTFSEKLAYPAEIKSNTEKNLKLEEIIDAVRKLGNAKGVIILTDERTLFHTQKYIDCLLYTSLLYA